MYVAISVVFHPGLDALFYSTPRKCQDCGESYTSVPSHRAVCGRKETICIYPDASAENGFRSIVLRRVDGYFNCVRCGKRLKKDQGMRVSLFSEPVPRAVSHTY